MASECKTFKSEKGEIAKNQEGGRGESLLK